jgi:glycerol-3-phosphate acyltransferase PlsY
MWPVGVIAFVLWALVIAAAGYVSLGTIVGALSLVPATLIVYPGDRARLVFAATAAILTIARHRDNMRRLAQGTESRFRRPGARDADDDRGSDTDA